MEESGVQSLRTFPHTQTERTQVYEMPHVGLLCGVVKQSRACTAAI